MIEDPGTRELIEQIKSMLREGQKSTKIGKRLNLKSRYVLNKAQMELKYDQIMTDYPGGPYPICHALCRYCNNRTKHTTAVCCDYRMTHGRQMTDTGDANLCADHEPDQNVIHWGR